jgi:hypothetical protein
MPVNLLNGQNVNAALLVPYNLGDLWFFYTQYRRQRQHLQRLCAAHAIGERILPGTLYADAEGELRRVRHVEKGLAAWIDSMYGPHIEAVHVAPEHQPGRPGKQGPKTVVALHG